MLRNTVVFLLGVRHLFNMLFFIMALLMFMTLMYKSIRD